MISKRIIEELEEDEVKHRLFVRKQKPRQSQRSSSRSSNYKRNYNSSRRK